MKLVIVESPAKCTTIKKYLGDGYEVKASLGHIRDLATSGKGGLGIDVDNGFKPTYIINKEKGHIVRELQNLANKSDEVILATDPDREGEAIAWHLANVLNLDVKKAKRLEFHEITRDSIGQAMASPRTINTNLVEAQETRRIIDRIIGFKLSSLVYKKIRARSAGRVQTVALKLISDHDREIAAFVPSEYWNVLTKLKLDETEISLTYLGKDGKNEEIKDGETANEILNLIPENLIVEDVKKEFRFKESKEPFTTSTLQQEAFSRLKFKTKKTQFIAQELYEGINVGDEHMGLITYMRTDSTRLSATFIDKASKYIIETFGEEYLGKVKKGHISEMAQDAHEAIRPTSNHRTPKSIKQYLTPDQFNLYQLIYNRAVGSLMKPKKEEVLTITLSGNGLRFKFELVHTVFKGYEAIIKDVDDEEEFKKKFPDIKVGDSFKLSEKKVEQKFTQPPAHYSEAKIVKIMEEVGIGRPSTYASTIETIKKRKYVEDTKGILTCTEQGDKTSRILFKYFPEIIDVKYTANMEKHLDNIEKGNEKSVEFLNSFYGPFLKVLEEANEKIYKDSVVYVDNQFCPECGSPLVMKEGRNGTFVACSNYPKCKYVQKEEKEAPALTGEVCPNCGKPMVFRKDKKGNVFESCSGYPKCKYIKQKDTPIVYDEKDYVKKCPDCGGWLVKKKGKYGTFLGCINYPTCKHMEKIIKKKRK